MQSADTDVEWLARLFKSTRGRRALHFREDFCGTGLLSARWIQQSDEHSAEVFDIDPDPVAWGLAHNLEPLGEVASRYTVHLQGRALTRPAPGRPARGAELLLLRLQDAR